MKKIILLVFATLMLVSCGSKKSYIRFSSVIDFSKYTQNGFFITESNSVNFSYDPIGSVFAYIESGYEVVGEKKSFSSDEVYGTSSKTIYGKHISAKSEDALEELYQKCLELESDGVINLKIVYTPFRVDSDNKVISWESYYVSGMAIKRK